MVLKVVSYNIHRGVGADRRLDLERIAGVLRETDPDVAALQEVGDMRPGARQDHPEFLAKALGLHLAFGPNVVAAGQRYGNAVLSRFPIVRSRNYDLSVPGREPRGALRCDLDAGGALLHVFCLHLGLRFAERRTQESLLLSADILRDAARAHPVAVCGDFNYWWRGTIPGLVRRSLRDSAQALDSRGATFPARRPLFRLDRIYLDDGLLPLRLSVHASPTARRASDHLPLVLEARTAGRPNADSGQLGSRAVAAAPRRA